MHGFFLEAFFSICSGVLFLFFSQHGLHYIWLFVIVARKGDILYGIKYKL